MGVHQRGVALQDLVGRGAVADPQMVWRFGIPGGGGFGGGDFPCQRILAARADLAGGEGSPGTAGEAQQDCGGVVGFDDLRFGGTFGSGEGFNRAGGFLALRMGGEQVGHDGSDLLAGDEADEVHPMGADVADRPQRAAFVGVEPPVPVGGARQPVLMVVAGDQFCLPQVGHRLGVLVQRIKADVVADGGDFAAGFGEGDHLGGLGGGHGERLFTDHMAACGEDLLHLGVVKGVGGGDVDDLHGGVGQQVIERGVGARDAQCLRGFSPSCGAGPQNSPHRQVQTPQGIDMHSADEAGADHRRANSVTQPNSLRRWAGRPR